MIDSGAAVASTYACRIGVSTKRSGGEYVETPALLGLIALSVGCASHASPTTATSQPKLRDGRGVEYPKEISLGARMHIEAWGCKGAETGSIALSPPPVDLSDPRNYGPGRRHDIRIGGDAVVTVDKEGRFSTDLYIRPDGVEGRYRVTGLCFGPGDAVSPYADLEQWFDVLPKRYCLQSSESRD